MKPLKPIFIFVLFLIFFWVFIKYIRNNNKISNTNIKVKEKIIDVGTVTSKDTIVRSYVIYNMGPKDLYIQKIKPDCQCTGAETDKMNKPISLNDSVEIVLKYSPKVSGTFQISAIVEMNSDEFPLLLMRGDVVLQ